MDVFISFIRKFAPCNLHGDSNEWILGRIADHYL